MKNQSFIVSFEKEINWSNLENIKIVDRLESEIDTQISFGIDYSYEKKEEYDNAINFYKVNSFFINFIIINLYKLDYELSFIKYKIKNILK